MVGTLAGRKDSGSDRKPPIIFILPHPVELMIFEFSRPLMSAPLARPWWRRAISLPPLLTTWLDCPLLLVSTPRGPLSLPHCLSLPYWRNARCCSPADSHCRHCLAACMRSSPRLRGGVPCGSACDGARGQLLRIPAPALLRWRRSTEAAC